MITAFETTVLSLIGNNDRITYGKIAELLGVDRRKVEHAVESMRDAGYPICSDCSTKPYGLYVAQTEAQARQWIRQMYSRINKMFKKCRAANQYWSKKDDLQLSLFDTNGTIPDGTVHEVEERIAV